MAAANSVQVKRPAQTVSAGDILSTYRAGVARDKQLKAGLTTAIASRDDATVLRAISDVAAQIWGRASDTATSVVAAARVALADPRTKAVLRTLGGIARSVVVDYLIKALPGIISAL